MGVGVGVGVGRGAKHAGSTCIESQPAAPHKLGRTCYNAFTSRKPLKRPLDPFLPFFFSAFSSFSR